MANYSKEFLVACTIVDVEQLTFDELKQLIIILHTNIYGLPNVQSDTSSDTLCDDCQYKCQCTPSASGSDDESDNELDGPPAPVVDAHTDAQSHDLPDASSNTQPATQVDNRPADQEPDTQPQPKIPSSPQPNVNQEQLVADFTELRTVINNQINSASQCTQCAPVYTQLAALTELLRSKFARWETRSEGVVGEGSTANTSGAHNHEAGAAGGSATSDVTFVGQGGMANASGAHHHEAGSGGDATSSDVMSTSKTKKQKRKKKSKNKAKEEANTGNVEDHDVETEEVQDEDYDGEEDDVDHDGEVDDEEKKGVQESERGNEHSWADEVEMSNGETHEWGVGNVATGPWQTVTRKKKAWKKTG
jgi:hypothetical protein